MASFPRWLVGAVALLLLPGAGPRPLALRHVALDLPGAPAAIVAEDLDGDGLTDLLVPVIYTRFEEKAFERVEGMIHVTEVVPALFDRRELRVFLARPDGSYRMVGGPLPLPPSVHSLEAEGAGGPVGAAGPEGSGGPAGGRALALTDDGVAAVRLGPTAGEGPGDPSLRFEPLIAGPPVLAGSGSFLPSLRLLADLDGEGGPDLLLPGRDGPAIHRASSGGYESSAASRIAMPGDRRGAGRTIWRIYPIPEVRDVDADRRPDLVVRGGASSDDLFVMRGEGGARFAAPRRIRTDCLESPGGPAGSTELNWFGDLDGDGRAEAVTTTEREDEDDGELEEARRPHTRLRFFRLREDLSLDPHPYQDLEVIGYPFGGEWPRFDGSGFKDLDGDGRLDLVTITLDFSLFQIVRALTTKRIGIGLDFHVWAQEGGGRFVEVPGLDLSEKIQVDLDNFKLGRFAQFNGDFDGDGRIDFVHLGRGRTVTIHRGQPGCRYAARPDLSVDLAEEPEDLALVQVRDLDGDGRSDLAVTRSVASGDRAEPGATAPLRLDLYLSRAPR